MKQTRRKFIKTSSLSAIALTSGIGFCNFGCKKSDSLENDTNLEITGVSIPASIDVAVGGYITITGKGFTTEDQIRFSSSSDESIEYKSNVSSITNNTVTFPLADEITSGTYKISVLRGTESLVLCSVVLNIVANTDIPDIEGMTVKGVIYCNGAGIAGVTVSDGYEVTTTDSNGIYYLASEKANGYVFISVPGNYEVLNINNAPQFFKRLSSGTTVEQKDFSLIKVDNSKHVVLSMADWHLANRNNDLSQLSDEISDINSVISDYTANGTKVYGLTLGDLTWDLYWYNNNYGLSNYLTEMHKIDCTVFNLMGNHDNDPYCSDNKLAEETYKEIIGPTYYSFNLGNIHYVVLDDTEYINTGGSDGIVGERNYNDVVISAQMEWLKKDLATITDKTIPLIIAMHCPLYSNPELDSDCKQVNSLSLNNGSALISLLNNFSDVHILSGHAHINYSVEPSESLMEHNIGAMCATWWWTGKDGYADNHICKDGSPGGYGILEIDNTDLSWLYKSAGYKDYQFRSYDRNMIHITSSDYAPNSTDEALSKYAGDYAILSNNNEVLINVWGYDSQWKIEVKENGQSLDVTRVKVLDPLHIISYEAKKLNAGSTPTSAFVTKETSHMFKVLASKSDSTLDISVTDRFGNIYTETMTRPKEFTCSMK